ncbi:hypothetical protein CCZ01_03325 [Helicobacter monodelphidis]|uniref:biopolymer transporter ExbD n=1 Tax=Helicobacter sp. 15-1451 TaxID=2004995 RepID=UPI000DCEF415|nr:biopolymer transporter ExbD [Helicobacter sp. 15-1451]RAX58124.1 hypothetical protein CCZ01_03325 [Helicobacter sp. 15-1451]
MKMQKIEGINVVPFIDIILVLLVIILMETSFIKTNRVSLVENQITQEGQTLKNEISLSITEEGDFIFEQTPMSLEQIRNRLVLVDKKTPIAIYGDSQSAFKQFIALFSLLKELELENISMMSQQQKE